MVLIPFLLQWGYFALFEGLWHGQTPGKRVAKIRVIQQSGRAITIFESLSRNLVRVVDFLPAFYVVGTISIFITKRNQRLGDLVAGTLVVHEGQSRDAARLAIPGCSRRPRRRRLLLRGRRPFRQMRSAGWVWPTCRRSKPFLSGASTWRWTCGSLLPARLAASTAARMNLPPPANMHPETFLEEAAYGVRSLGKLR